MKYLLLLFIFNISILVSECINLESVGFQENNSPKKNTEIFQSALDKNKCVIIPSGKFKLTRIIIKENHNIQGMGSSINGKDGTVLVNLDKNCLFYVKGHWKKFDSRRDIKLRNITIINNNKKSISFKADFLTRFILENLYFKGNAKYHLFLENSYNGVVRDSSFIGASIANVIFKTKDDKNDNVFSGQTLWSNCDFWNSKNYGFLLETPYNLNEQNVFIKSHFKKNKIGFLQKGGGSCTFLGDHFEGNKIHDIKIEGDYNPSLINCFFNNSITKQSGIEFNGDMGIIQNCRFVAYSNSVPIVLNGKYTKIDTNLFRLKTKAKLKTIILINGKNNIISNFILKNFTYIKNPIFEKNKHSNIIEYIHIENRKKSKKGK